MTNVKDLSNAQLKARIAKVDICLAFAVDGSRSKKELEGRLNVLIAEHFEREMSGGLRKCKHCNGTGAASVLPRRINCPYCQGTSVPVLEKARARMEGLGI